MLKALTCTIALLFGVIGHLHASIATLAGSYQPTYEEDAPHWRLSLDEAAKGARLHDQDRKTVYRVVGGWVHLGPCRGKISDLPRDRPDAIGFVDWAKLSDPMGAAILGMIAILSGENLGREPPAHVCSFALDLA